MADGGEKTAPTEDVHQKPTAHSIDNQETGEIPSGWMYRSRKIGPIKFPWYASPESQLLLVAFTCFLCPGMFNALNGLGGGGQLNRSAGDASNTALYSTFSVVGFFAGSITNWVGIKWALAFGGTGYAVYTSSYLCYNITENFGYIVFAGFFLGICAGILWAAQGAIMMSYPLEKDKGRYISWFWIIFNLGGVIGSLVRDVVPRRSYGVKTNLTSGPLAENIHVRTNSKVSNGTYIGFLILTVIGACMALTLVDAKKVVRTDGSRIILMKHPTWKSEIFGLYQTLRSDPYIIFMWPMFFASNWFYVYQFNDVNLAKFNTRTRALNNVLYWTMQMVGATVFGYALDYGKLSRRTRARAAWVALLVLTMAIWGGGYAFQKPYTRAEFNAKELATFDWTSPGYGGPLVLYMFYGFYDAAWQTTVYWLMGALTNNSRKLANFAGFYKGIQSAGGAITWRIDGLSHGAPSFMSMFASCWGLLGGGLLCALPVVLTKVRDHIPIEEDVAFTDETVEDVLGHKVMDRETPDEIKV